MRELDTIYGQFRWSFEEIYRTLSLYPRGAANDFLRNRVAIVCAVLHRLAVGLLVVLALICAIFVLK